MRQVEFSFETRLFSRRADPASSVRRGSRSTVSCPSLRLGPVSPALLVPGGPGCIGTRICSARRQVEHTTALRGSQRWPRSGCSPIVGNISPAANMAVGPWPLPGTIVATRPLATGLEPRTDRAGFEPAVEVSPYAGLANRGAAAADSGPTDDLADSCAEAAEASMDQLPRTFRTQWPELAEVVRVWPGLDEPIRAAIVQLCRVKSR